MADRTHILVAALAGLALTAPSAFAQVPELPRVDVPPPVESVVSEPLPAPAEKAVNDSPVAPVREELRRAVGGPSAASPATTQTTRPRTSSAAPAAGGRSTTEQRRGTQQRRARRHDSARRRSRRATARAADERTRPAKPNGEKAADRRNPVARTILKIVQSSRPRSGSRSACCLYWPRRWALARSSSVAVHVSSGETASA